MRLSSYSITLVFIVLGLIGVLFIPSLSLQYLPSSASSSLTVSYNWRGASARVIEKEVTSKLEGLFSTISGKESISSVSSKDRGSVKINLKRGTDIQRVRFELMMLIRQIYSSLPPGVSYPVIGYDIQSRVEDSKQILSYSIVSERPLSSIYKFGKESVIEELDAISGVNKIDISEVGEQVILIEVDPLICKNFDLEIYEIYSSISSIIGEPKMGIFNNTSFEIRGQVDFHSLQYIPIKTVNDKIIRVGDVANISLFDNPPSRYSRINGLNTVNISFFADKGSNYVKVISNIKNRVKELSQSFPSDIDIIVISDLSQEINKELNKIYIRVLFSLSILMLFVFIVSRSIRYVVVIFITLIVNILVAIIFYNLFDIELHVYSLAGITVSLGIIIDTSIIMISHYSYFKNRKAFIAILAAILTTVGSLSVFVFLPEELKIILRDFSSVIIINLLISLLVALLFVPALIDRYPIEIFAKQSLSLKRVLRVVKFNSYYKKYIAKGLRYRSLLLLFIILFFGLPVFMLPKNIDGDDSLSKIYNATLGSDFYNNKLRSKVDVVFGGSLRLFSQKVSSSGWLRSFEREELYISASMPDGCTVEQMNSVIKFMENHLAQYDQIDAFYTNINSHKSGQIRVVFKKEYSNCPSLLMIKNNVISTAVDFGGANWNVAGLDDNYFSNRVSSGDYRSYSITLNGYNYDKLYDYAQWLEKKLEESPRVADIIISSQRAVLNEYYIEVNKERLALYNISLRELFQSLSTRLSKYSVGNMEYIDGERYRIELGAVGISDFGIWNFNNEYIVVGNKLIKLSDIGSIEFRKSGNDIIKKDQQYELRVSFNFIGSYELANRVVKREVDNLNKNILPVGFKAKTESYRWDYEKSNYYLLILLIAIIIYFVCSVLFESFLQPFIIILLIPVSYTGLFLTFYIFDFKFDQGGFAAMILLSGLSVNAGIYLINQYNIYVSRVNNKILSTREMLKYYLKSFNIKIVPILLTIISTVLGLIPFLTDGPSEVFWFAFAAGTIGGLIWSILGIIFIIPIFLLKKVDN